MAGASARTRAGASSSIGDMVHPYFFEHLLDDTPLLSLLDAAHVMDSSKFLHGGTKRNVKFTFITVALNLSLDAETLAQTLTEEPPGALQGAHKALTKRLGAVDGLQGLLAVRAWTGTPICYILCSVLRCPGRTRAIVTPVLLYCQLLLSALHAFPE